MNFYFDAVKLLDRIDSKQGSIKGILATAAEKDRKRLSALVIETLKCVFSCSKLVQMLIFSCPDRAVLSDILQDSNLMRNEGKTIKSTNLGLLLVHDLLFSNGIQAGEGPIKNAILRHKTRLNAELQRQKIKRGVTSNAALAQSADDRAGRALKSGPNCQR
jgi:25S rRNA (cytosine2278-C5)-methyltransferase